MTKRPISRRHWGITLIMAIAFLCVVVRWPGVEPTPSSVAQHASSPNLAEVSTASLERELVMSPDSGYLGQVEHRIAAAKHALVVTCVERLKRSPLPGVRVLLARRGGDGHSVALDTDTHGRVRFGGLSEGDYYMQCQDTEGLFAYVGSSIGALEFQIPGLSEVVCEFAPALVADVEIVGDELLSVYTWRHSPGLHLALGLHRSPVRGVGSDGRAIYDHYPASAKRRYVLASKDPPDEPFLEIGALTANHGEQLWRVPLVPARRGMHPQVLRVTGARVPASIVQVNVVDSDGRQCNPGRVVLTVPRSGTRPRRMVRVEPNAPFVVPPAKLGVRIGDFPVRWSCPECRSVDATASGLHTVTARVDWPLTRLESALVKIDGDSISEKTILYCKVSGDFRDHGQGAGPVLVRGGRLPTGDYPVGRVVFRLQAEDMEWEVDTYIRVGQSELVLDITRANARRR